MVDRIKNNAPAEPHSGIRNTLFGDLGLDDWAKNSNAGESWVSFAAAKAALDRDDQRAGIRILNDILHRPGLESRHYLQCWHFLKQLDVEPPAAKAKELLGVIIEVGMKSGLDLLAAYADLKARYYNFSGAGVVWERPDASLDSPIQQLLNAAQGVVAKIGPWNKPRPEEPPNGQIRINMLTPAGLHFGQGLLPKLAADPLGGPVVTAATALTQAMISKARK